MKNILFLVLVFFQLQSISSYSQNMVANPGFEDTLACPVQIGLINNVAGWTTCGVTPDYFHSCANTTHPNHGVPFNNRGFQPAHSGNAYIGIFTYSVFNQNLREFIGSALLQPLVVGQQYFVSFWAAHPDTSVLHFATDKLGVKFTTVQHTLMLPDTVGNFAHVFSTSLITDTLGWTLVRGSFIADSAYTFIEIGNFFEDSQTTIQNLGSGSPNYAYYFIDDVCVTTDSAICGLSTGIREDDPNYFSVFPNPADDEITIRSKSFSHVDVSLSNALSTTVFSSVLKNDEIIINTINFSPGLYFLEITVNGIRKTQKILISH
jgi:hypothetical protein